MEWKRRERVDQKRGGKELYIYYIIIIVVGGYYNDEDDVGSRNPLGVIIPAALS